MLLDKELNPESDEDNDTPKYSKNPVSFQIIS